MPRDWPVAAAIARGTVDVSRPRVAGGSESSGDTSLATGRRMRTHPADGLWAGLTAVPDLATIPGHDPLEIEAEPRLPD